MNSRTFAYLSAVLTSTIIVVTAMIGPNTAPTSSVLHDVMHIAGILIPSINQLSSLSSFPQVTKLVFSVTWLLIPIQVLCFTWYSISAKLPAEIANRLRKNRRAIMLFLLGLMPFYLYAAMFWLGAEYSSSKYGVSNFIESQISTSRVALGIAAVTLCLGLSTILSFTIFYIFRIAFIRKS